MLRSVAKGLNDELKYVEERENERKVLRRRKVCAKAEKQQYSQNLTAQGRCFTCEEHAL